MGSGDLVTKSRDTHQFTTIHKVKQAA